jgi:RNA polymerase sigma-70 factor, ECF subfamily
MSVNDMECEVSCGIESENYIALTQLFGQRRNRLIRAALRITRNEEDAEDVVQEAAVRALVNLHSFRGESRIDTWIHAIIGNSAINRLRSPSRRREVSLDSETTGHQNVLPYILSDANISPEQSCVRHELHEIIHLEIDGLKDSYRDPIQLCDLGGRSYEEAAEVLNLNLPKFKARLYRGRRVLRKRLSERIVARQR